MFYFAKFLEALGMGLAATGLLIGMSSGDTRVELFWLAVGGVLFLVGYLMERRMKPKAS